MRILHAATTAFLPGGEKDAALESIAVARSQRVELAPHHNRAPHGDRFVDRVLELEALDPEWAQGFVNWVYGTVYPRRVLDPKVRALITVGQHIALGNWRAMVTHVKAALHFGATREELIEVC